MSCIYSTINFAIDQAKHLNIETLVLTFDQPLWLKATEIINTKSIKIVLILGGFHLMMSFLGSTGTLMKGSGISEALQTVYGEKRCRTYDEWQNCNKSNSKTFYYVFSPVHQTSKLNIPSIV